jgi:Cu+-exporting ATPase
MIPLAVIGWMHPVLAEIAMATSSVSVVGNANRLRRVDIRPSYQREAEAEEAEEPIPTTAEATV